MATGVVSWSQTAATNATADANINWAEGMAPSQVNDSARALMASVAKYRDDQAGFLTTGGSSTALTVTTNQVFTSLAELHGQSITLFMGTAVDAGATLNVDGLGAKSITVDDNTLIVAGQIPSSSTQTFTYDNNTGFWYVHNIGFNIFLPPGIILPYGATSAPNGWLLCDGSAVSRTGSNARLFAIIGTTFGVGDGATTFNVPDLRARTVFGYDAGSASGRMAGAHTGNLVGAAASIGNTGGEENHGLTTAELPTFTPSGTIGGSQTFSNVVTSAGGQNVGSAASPAVNVPGSITVNGSNFTFTGNAVGSGNSHNTIPPGIVLNYIIKK